MQGWGRTPPLLPAALLRAPSFPLQSFPTGQLRTPCRVTDPGRRRGGRDHPLSVLLLLLLKLCWNRSRGCGSPELVAQQLESINMLCRKCRGSPSCCQRAGLEDEGDSGSHCCLTPIWSHPIFSKHSISHRSFPLSPSLRYLMCVSPDSSGKVPRCLRSLLLQGFCF